MVDELFETSASESQAEIQNENVQETPEQIHELANQLSDEELKQKGVDDPKSFRYWNSKYDKEVSPLKSQVETLNQKLQEYSAKLEKVSEFENVIEAIKNPVKKPEPLVEPNPPSSDDPLEQIDYLKKLSTYNKKIVDMQRDEFNQFKGSIEKERQAQLESQKAAQYKAYVAGKLQSVGGLKPEEALEAINIYSKAQSNEDEYFKDLSEFFKYKKNKGLTTKTKTEQPNQPLPPGINSGTNVSTPDETQEFMGKMGRSDNSWVFQTK